MTELKYAFTYVKAYFNFKTIAYGHVPASIDLAAAVVAAVGSA
jgi:hypothetical protein